MGNEKKIIKIINPPKKKIKQVGIYCRVSTSHTEQEDSLEYQIAHYTKMVQNNPDWNFVDVYADIYSGKTISKRPEFQRMLKDCEEHKINFIITKAVSRFGRNTVDTLEALQKLKELEVEVYFDAENILTSEANANFLISIFEAIAQAESESVSQNIKWGIQNGFRLGTSKLYSRKCYGYCQDADGNLIIKQDEAEIVRRIFSLYLDGHSILSIIRALYEQGIPSPTGKEKWSKRTVDTILSNEKYAGNVVTAKTYSNDYPDNKRLINRGERQQYLMSDSHPPIISQEWFDRIQNEKARRSNIDEDENGEVKRKNTHYSMKKIVENPQKDK